jgi:hypothetical protein
MSYLCNDCFDRAQERTRADGERRAGAPGRFLAAMASAGNPGAVLLPTADGLGEATGERVRCWKIGIYRYNEPTPAGYERSDGLYLGVDGVVYRAGLVYTKTRFGRRTSEPGLRHHYGWHQPAMDILADLLARHHVTAAL